MKSRDSHSFPPASLGQVVRAFIERNLPPHLAEEGQVFQAWVEAAGPELTRQTKPLSFRGQTLFVAVKSNAWAFELNQRRRTIRDRMNGHLGKKLVNDLFFKVENW